MLPGWDSLEVTSAYAKWFTYAGFAALFLLGVFEIIAHVYSVHEKTLSEAAARREADDKRAEANARILEAEARVAEANLELARLRQRQEQRGISFPHQKFLDSLKAKPTGSVVIMYQPDDVEASVFASYLSGHLFSSGWKVNSPVPIPPDLVTPNLRGSAAFLRTLPAVIRVGGQPTGISIVANSIDDLRPAKPTPLSALVEAFSACGVSTGLSINQELETNAFWLIVGPKP